MMAHCKTCGRPIARYQRYCPVCLNDPTPLRKKSKLRYVRALVGAKTENAVGRLGLSSKTMMMLFIGLPILALLLTYHRGSEQTSGQSPTISNSLPSKLTEPAISPNRGKTPDTPQSESTNSESTESSQVIDSSLFDLPPSQQRWMPALLKAARLVKQNPQCLEVITGSTEPGHDKGSDPTFFITCRIPQLGVEDYANFYVRKSELSSVAIPGLPKPVSEQKAQDRCRNFIQHTAKFPSTVSYDWLGITSSVATNGNWEVLIDFVATNSVGANLPYRARCIVLPNGKTEGNLSAR